MVCSSGGVFVVVFLCCCFCAGVFVVLFLRWCFCGGVLAAVFLWWCFRSGVFVVVRRTKYYSSTTKYYSALHSTVLLQYHSVLQSTTPHYKALKYYSVLQCTTKHYARTTPFDKNEHLLRGFRNFSRNKLPKQAFRTRLPPNFTDRAAKTPISCVASGNVQRQDPNRIVCARLPPNLTIIKFKEIAGQARCLFSLPLPPSSHGMK